MELSQDNSAALKVTDRNFKEGKLNQSKYDFSFTDIIQFFSFMASLKQKSSNSWIGKQNPNHMDAAGDYFEWHYSTVSGIFKTITL